MKYSPSKKTLSSSLHFYSRISRAFALLLTISSVFVFPLLPPVSAQASNAVLLAGTTTQGQTNSTTSDIWYKVVALPLFNDSMLGASSVTSYDPVIPGLGEVYNFIMIIAIIVITVGGAIALILKRIGKYGTDSMIMDVIVGLVAVIAFPSIYDGVARMINYLTQALIAYPNPFYDYGSTLQVLWNAMEFAHGWSLWTLLTNSFLQIVFFIISGVIYIMLFFLGVARIFLIGAMIVAFPLSMGLRLIPFTKKLSTMIDDTLFGLMLSSVMSAIVLGVGSYILSPSVWTSSSGNIFFQAVGQNGQNWVAASALLTAILLPTVLAPLTATIFQTASQVAMTGVGVATMIASGVAAGGAGGLGAAGSAIETLGKTAKIAGLPPPTVAQKLVAGMKAFGSTGLPAIGYNVATLGTAGFVSAIGASSGGSVMRRAIPLQTPRLMASRARSQQAAQITRAHVDTATDAIENMNTLNLPKVPISGVHFLNPVTGVAVPSWNSIELPAGEKIRLLDSSNEEELGRFVAKYPSHQDLSNSLVDSKIITQEASKSPQVESQIKQLHSTMRNMDLKDEASRQKIANLHNHIAMSNKLGRGVKNEDFGTKSQEG